MLRKKISTIHSLSLGTCCGIGGLEECCSAAQNREAEVCRKCWRSSSKGAQAARKKEKGELDIARPSYSVGLSMVP